MAAGFTYLIIITCKAVVLSGIEVGLMDVCDVVHAGRMVFRTEVEVLDRKI